MFFKSLFSGLSTSGPKAAVKKVQQGAILIDVRPRSEFNLGAAIGAMNVPLENISKFADELNDKKQAIVVYCLSGGRSSQAARIFSNKGFRDVTNGGSVQAIMQAQI